MNIIFKTFIFFQTFISRFNAKFPGSHFSSGPNFPDTNPPLAPLGSEDFPYTSVQWSPKNRGKAIQKAGEDGGDPIWIYSD